MKLFNKREAIIYFEDRRCYVANVDENKSVSTLYSFDIPMNVLNDGEILDSAQLHYLLKKTLEENELTKSHALFVINSASAVNRTMHVPSMTEKERASLIENECPSLFPQDLEEFALDSVDLKTDDDIHHLLITICPEEILEGYRDLAKKCEIKLRGIIPFSTLCLEYAHWLGGARVNFVGTSHLGFYYGHENRFFDRTEVNDSVLDFMARNELEAEDVLRIKNENFDERMSDVNPDVMKREMQSAYYEALGHVEHMGGDFALADRQLIAGSFMESGLFSALMDEEVYKPLNLADVFAAAAEHGDVAAMFSGTRRSGGGGKNYYLPIGALVVAFAILIGSFIYGEKLKQQNRDLIVRTHEQEMAQDESDSTEGGSGAQKSADIADAITKVKSSAPDTLTVTGMDYQNGTLSIRGEAKDANEIQNWCSQLEDVLKVKVEEEPTATVGDVIYFQLTAYLIGGEEGDSAPSEETDDGMDTAGNEMMGDEMTVNDAGDNSASI